MATSTNNKKQIFFLVSVIVLYVLAVWYVAVNDDLSWEAMFKAGLLQHKRGKEYV